MPQKVIKLLNRGLEANSSNGYRQGNTVVLPEEAELVVSGDIHGHRRNLERVLSFTALDEHAERHLVLQEIIHGGPQDGEGGCQSYKLLYDAIEYKLQFPNRVHFIMANHDTAFISNSRVMKAGQEMNRSMREAMNRHYSDASEDVKLALSRFLFSQPLAVRCPNKIMVSHSLPAERHVDQFDPSVLNRSLKINDVVRPGSAYLLTWGRKHTPELLEKMAKTLDVKLFVLGHQRKEQGWAQVGDNALIITSEHAHGTLLKIDLARSYSMSELIDEIVPLASIQ
jgi:hypothetical protein